MDRCAPFGRLVPARRRRGSGHIARRRTRYTRHFLLEARLRLHDSAEPLHGVDDYGAVLRAVEEPPGMGRAGPECGEPLIVRRFRGARGDVLDDVARVGPFRALDVAA